jgi:hypothetical protein
MQNPLGHVPGFHVPGTTIPIGAITGASLPLPYLSAADRERKSAYRQAMEEHATCLRKRLRYLAQQLALSGVPLTPRNRPTRRKKRIVGGYRTEYEHLDPAWPVITFDYGGNDWTVFGRGERELGVTAGGDIVPMKLAGHWHEDRYISESADRNFNRDVIEKVYPGGESVAINIIRVLELMARESGISISVWEPVKRPECYPIAWGVGNCEPGYWVLRED